MNNSVNPTNNNSIEEFKLSTVTNDLINPQESLTFPKDATTAEPLFFRSYSRKLPNGNRENWYQSTLRVATYLKEVGKLTNEEFELIFSQQLECKSFFSGRLNWVAGTEWLNKPENFYGSFNCNSTNITDIESFGLLMNLAMQGTGTGAVLEPKYIEQLPPILNKLNVEVLDKIGAVPKGLRADTTDCIVISDKQVFLYVGDSRQGWVDSYTQLLYLATDPKLDRNLEVKVFVGNVRQKGEDLKGFGGVANPVKLPELYGKVAKVTNKAVGRQLNAVECCLIIDEAMVCIVAGNIRRSAGMKQFNSADTEAATAKDNLWQQGEDGQWRIDPERDALRMSNHTRVFHHKPTLEEITASVTKQYYSGEGAIQFAPEAIARANADLLDTDESRIEFIQQYCISEAHGLAYLEAQAWHKGKNIDVKEAEHRLSRYGTNPCGEIIGSNLFCNLGEVHLNRLDPFNLEEIRLAFKAASISVCTLLQQGFVDERYQYSRDLDPIVGVSFTGLFDFFVNAFGVDWLKWWQLGRPAYIENTDPLTHDTLEKLFDNLPEQFRGILHDWDHGCGVFKNEKDSNGFDINDDGLLLLELEKAYLQFFKTVVNKEVTAYCVKHGLKVPNRYTTCQPAGSKSLLTGASAGWHPPKASVYIRRMTFDRDNPIALACMDYGYNVIPGQSDKDENGNLLTDPFDQRCTEWLVEMPFKCGWADIPGCSEIDINKFSVAAQYDFYMQVQQHYTTHNSSATLELRESEIPILSELIHNTIQNDEGYISAALLARFDSLETFPRMPFEPITLETYNKLYQDVLDRRKANDFVALLAQYDQKAVDAFNQGAAGCDSDKCLMPEKTPNMNQQQIPVIFETETVGFVQSLETVGDRTVGTISISSEAANKLMNEMLGTVDL